MNVKKFYVCACYFEHYVYIWNKQKCSDPKNDCGSHLSNFVFYFGGEVVQVCYECLYQKLPSTVLSLEPVSKVLGNDCFTYRTSSWFDNVRTSENCYMEFMDCIKDAKVSNETAPYYIRVLYACCVRY